MQRCQKCGRTYENETQKFCTHDGGRLVPDDQVPKNQAPTAYDLNQTVRTDPFDPEATVQRMPDLNRTVISNPTSEIRSKDTGPAVQPPSAPVYQPPPPPAPYQPDPPQQPTVLFNQQPTTPPTAMPPQQPPPPQSPPSQQYYQQPPQQQQPPPPPQPPPAPYVPQSQPPSAPLQQQPSAPTLTTPYQPPAPPPQYAPAPPPQQQNQQYQQPQQQGAQAPAKPGKSSKVPLIIGLVVILLAGGAAAWYFLIYKKQAAATSSNSNVSNTNASANTNANANASTNTNSNESANANTNANTSEPPPPPNSTRFVNSKASLDGKLAENYSDFSFYYPNSWERDPKTGVAGASNFIRVERRLPPDFTQENFTVSWYESKGTYEKDDEEAVFQKLIASQKAKLASAFQEFKVVSEGETTVNGNKGYEFRFQAVSKGTQKGDITLWGRIIFLPPGKEGETHGVQLLMLTSSLAPELTSAEDVGVKGELPMILNSFKMGSK